MAAIEDKPCWINENLPPPVASTYTPKGTWQETGELKSYVVGPQSSNKALIMVYDAFGPGSQCLQGADRLAEHLNNLVFMPDFFRGDQPDYEKYVNDSEAYMPVLRQFMQAKGDIPTSVRILLDLVPVLKSKFPTVQSWGVFGLCWGGKVAVLASIAENQPFKTSGQTHPGRMEAADARALRIPHICMPSKDEPADVIADYEKILAENKTGKVVFFDIFHGWMGVRADLANEEQRVQYERGYKVAAEFFAQHL